MTRNIVFALLFSFLGSLVFQSAAYADSVELVPSSRVILKINEGMTIDDIIARIYPKDKDLWPLIREKLIETNPNSFAQYSDRLITGVRLRLVDVKRIYAEKTLSPKTRVGFVAQMGGRATAQDVNGRIEQLLINSEVFEGDRIETEAGSSVYLTMIDGAEVFLKEDSVMKINEYVMTTGIGENSSSVLDLLRGAFRKITGAIGKSALANYQVHTGVVTIGVRGTEYVVKLCHLDDCTRTVSRNDPNAKLHAVVLEGVITLTTDEEVQILMAMGEYGTATADTLLIEEEAPVPVGFLSVEETAQFEAAKPVPQVEPAAEESSSSWMWILGGLLLLGL